MGKNFIAANTAIMCATSKLVIVITILIASCAIPKSLSKGYSEVTNNNMGVEAPSSILGNFEDDYGIKYTINDTVWVQHPGTKYHIIRIDTTEKYLLALNDKDNKSGAGLYTRIDYMYFNVMEPYRWGFCLTVYNADTPEKAIAAAAADRKTPKTGCGGFPFSRMKRLN